MKLSPHGRALIQSFEGLSLTAYPDAGGWSIGYGHFGASPGQTITREEAESLFDRDVIKYETGVSLITPRTTIQQFDAMTSLAYNIGLGSDDPSWPGGFTRSTVARLHNAGDFRGAADAFRMWNKSQGAVHQGLVKRREREREVYLNGYGPAAPYLGPQTTTPTSPTHSPDGVLSTPSWPSTVPPMPASFPTALLLTLLGGAGWIAWALLKR
jgi:lysozyme